MYEIRDWLYIGKFSQTRNLSMLKQVGITAMLQLADYIPQPDMPILYLDVTDGESVPHDLIAEGVQFVREQKQASKRILVACGAGISRSALFVVATLMEDENRTLFDAYHEVYSMYRGAEPHPELVMSLSSYHGTELDLLEAWEALHDVRRQVDTSH